MSLWGDKWRWKLRESPGFGYEEVISDIPEKLLEENRNRNQVVQGEFWATICLQVADTISRSGPSGHTNMVSGSGVRSNREWEVCGILEVSIAWSFDFPKEARNQEIFCVVSPDF